LSLPTFSNLAKTSLARGLAHRTAQSCPSAGFRLLEVEPHNLTSSAMGKTHRAVSDLFTQAIAEAASVGPTIVLLDEVETLAVDRTKLGMDANPANLFASHLLMPLDDFRQQTASFRRPLVADFEVLRER
jgi:AAA+ superfamily predicted ATPase